MAKRKTKESEEIKHIIENLKKLKTSADKEAKEAEVLIEDMKDSMIMLEELNIDNNHVLVQIGYYKGMKDACIYQRDLYRDLIYALEQK